jgi:hypothetical protein
MTEAADISNDSRDARVLRIVAGFVFLAALAAMILGPMVAPWILVLLALDFGARGFGKATYSPLNAIARGLASAMDLGPAPVDAAPKRFAARVGVLIALTAAGLYLSGFMVAATATTGFLAICAALESTFGVCVPSKVWALLPETLASVLAR